MADTNTRLRLVGPLGSRGMRSRKTLDGDVVRYRPTVESLVRERRRRKEKKSRVVIRLKR